ncbi:MULTISPECIES: RNA polymerase sigma factor [unclassified Aureispira]|uniref:RNA polymerase sigma factor n=1 Tax=unclassified Aureispira TaxID=2649989 RepID=UPI000696F1D0|nr:MULTISPECIES: sigma-70 family RNA polymerase sigma factor [unclassified Aureispira]WMX14601.1 sigma-70 family RNA polymerase sigma factor [Aureispira sp. CCB-E]
MKELSERELVERCAADERQYQELLYRKYAGDMYKVCLMYANNKADAADILQESFIKVFKNIHRFRFEGSLRGWIRRTVVHTAINAYNKKQRDTQVIIPMAESGEVDASIDSIVGQLEANDIIKLVNSLPQKARQVLKLYAIEGYKHKEIAALLGITEGTSKSQFSRAKKMLQTSIETLHG